MDIAKKTCVHLEVQFYEPFRNYSRCQRSCQLLQSSIERPYATLISSTLSAKYHPLLVGELANACLFSSGLPNQLPPFASKEDDTAYLSASGPIAEASGTTILALCYKVRKIISTCTQWEECLRWASMRMCSQQSIECESEGVDVR